MVEKELHQMSKGAILDEIFNNQPSNIKPSQKETSRFVRIIKLKFNPFVDVLLGTRRCGECGEIRPLKEFKQKPVGYYYKCKKCRKYEKVYND